MWLVSNIVNIADFIFSYPPIQVKSLLRSDVKHRSLSFSTPSHFVSDFLERDIWTLKGKVGMRFSGDLASKGIPGKEIV